MDTLPTIATERTLLRVLEPGDAGLLHAYRDMPHKLRSEALLRRLGFEREGYARAYLRINGQWEDMVLNSLINEN